MSMTVTQIVLLVLGIMVVVGIVIAIVATKNAPQGYEDDEGFHEVVSNKKREKKGGIPVEV